MLRVVENKNPPAGEMAAEDKGHGSRYRSQGKRVQVIRRPLIIAASNDTCRYKSRSRPGIAYFLIRPIVRSEKPSGS